VLGGGFSHAYQIDVMSAIHPTTPPISRTRTSMAMKPKWQPVESHLVVCRSRLVLS
jgi:hypothetical protein